MRLEHQGQMRTEQPRHRPGLVPSSPRGAEAAATVMAQTARTRAKGRERRAWGPEGGADLGEEEEEGEMERACVQSPRPSAVTGTLHTLSSVILTMAPGASVNVPIFPMRKQSVHDDMTSPSPQLFNDRTRFPRRPLWLQSR